MSVDTQARSLAAGYSDKARNAEEIALEAKQAAETAVETAVEAVPAAVTTWLNANVNPVGSAVAVDSSLTISGAAADAKAAGDGIRELDDAVFSERILADKYWNYWRRNGTSSTTGEVSSSSYRICTINYISKGNYAVYPKTGYEIAILAYDNSGVYQGIWQGADAETAWVKSYKWFRTEIDLRALPDEYNYKVIAKSTAGAQVAILPSESSNIIFRKITDETLSIGGMPADAKATGEEINEFINAYLTEESPNFEWAQGNINTDTGANTTGNQDIRVKIRYTQETKQGVKIIIPDGMRIYVCLYSADNPSGSGSTFLYSYGWETGTIVVDGAPYFRLICSYTDNSEITPDDLGGLVITRFDLTDKSLALSGKAADSKTVGDRFSSIEEASDSIATITGEDNSTHTVQGITFTKKSNSQFELSGTSTNNNYYKFFHVLLGADAAATTINPIYKNITEPGTYTLAYNVSDESSPYRDRIFQITSIATQDAISLKNGESFEVTADKTYALYVRASPSANFVTPLTVDWALYKGENREGTPLYTVTAKDVVARAQAASALNDINNTSKVSWGVSNMLASARHMIRIPWTPVGNMPTNGQTNFFEIKEQYGIPYSSVRDQDKAVGMDVSIHTFMTAVKDPNSVLYTRRSTVSNSGTYYGAVCSGLINYATGIRLDLTNTYLQESDMFEDIPMMAIQIGDMIGEPGHVALISDIERDKWGRITMVQVSEEWSPLPRVVTYYGWDNFISNRSRYTARRYKNRDGVPYTAIPYIQCFDETPVTIVYPDVQTEFGDAAVFMRGENVKINVINTSDYTTITVVNGQTTVYTSNNIAPFTLTNVQPGLYTITANGGVNESVSTFFVVDATAAFNQTTGDITFSSTNANPVMVGVYNLPSDRRVLVKDIILSQAQINAGTINVLSEMDSEYKYAKVWFMTPYGTAVWYSETHDKWIEI